MAEIKKPGIFERKKKFIEPEKKEGKERTGKGIGKGKHLTRDDYEKDSYRWCYEGSAPPKSVRIVVDFTDGIRKKEVYVDGVKTYG